MTGPIACFGELRTIATAVEIWEKVKIVEWEIKNTHLKTVYSSYKICFIFLDIVSVSHRFAMRNTRFLPGPHFVSHISQFFPPPVI